MVLRDSKFSGTTLWDTNARPRLLDNMKLKAIGTLWNVTCILWKEMLTL